MCQEVKNPLRAQSKYGLMESSAKTGKKIFQGSPEHFLHKNAIWDRIPPPTHHLQFTCVWEVSRVPNLQTEFNYLDSFKSYGIFSDFIVPVVPTLSLSSPHCPDHPCVIPVIPIAPRRSPCGPHGCGLHPMLSPCHPRRPHIILLSSPSSLCHPHSPQKVPMWSPWLWSLWSPPHVVPVVPTSSSLSPHHPCCPHIIPIIPT